MMTHFSSCLWENAELLSLNSNTTNSDQPTSIPSSFDVTHKDENGNKQKKTNKSMLNILIKFWLIILTLSHNLELTWAFFSSIHRQQTLEMSLKATEKSNVKVVSEQIINELKVTIKLCRAERSCRFSWLFTTRHTSMQWTSVTPHNKQTHTPSDDELHHDSVWNHDAHHFLQHALLDTERKEKEYFDSPVHHECDAAGCVSECLLTCLMMPGWCLRASVCRPERCPASPCCWPAEAAACRPSAGSLRETTSPWDVETHIQVELHPWFYDPLVYYLVD